MFLDFDVSDDLTVRVVHTAINRCTCVSRDCDERSSERGWEGIPVSLLGDISAQSVIRQSRLHRVGPAVTRRGIQEGQILVHSAAPSPAITLKPKFSLCVIKDHTVKVYGRENV